LTGREHLEFYGRIKGLRGKDLQREVTDKLTAVNLYDARNKLSRKYSGNIGLIFCIFILNDRWNEEKAERRHFIVGAAKGHIFG
jgi:hypothetical protein